MIAYQKRIEKKLMDDSEIATSENVNIEYKSLSMVELKEKQKDFQKEKSRLQRQIDHIDTEIIGIKEALRQKNEEKRKLDKESWYRESILDY